MKKKLILILLSVIIFHTLVYSQNNMNIDPNMMPGYVGDVFTPSVYIATPYKAPPMIDLENKLNEIQANNQRLLNQKKQQDENGGQDVNIENAVHETFDNLNNNQSFGSKNQSVDINSSSASDASSGSGVQSTIDNNSRNIDRYQNSPCYQTLGFIPSDPNLEQKYIACESQKSVSNNISYLKFGVPIIIVLFLLYYMVSFFNKKNKKVYGTVPLSTLYNKKTSSKSTIKKPVAKK